MEEQTGTVKEAEVGASVELPLSRSDELKKQGNEAFVAKSYKQAIDLYTEALKVDPDNAVLYSNRSACFAALTMWQRAYEDALQSVSKDPKFVKAYYRLANAQTELQQFDDAETTLKAALALDSGSEVVQRQIKAVKQRKATAVAAAKAKKTPKKLDETQMKEFAELQEQIGVYSKDLRSVRMRLASLQRDARIDAVTTNHIQGLDESVPLYRAVGKAFLMSSKTAVMDKIEHDLAENTRTQRDLMDRSEYLERRIQSTTSNLQDLYGQ